MMFLRTTRFWHDDRGATIVEFAAIAPVLVMVLLALFDFSYNLYAKSMIEGAVQKAARDSTIERYSDNPDALDQRVREAVRGVVPSAEVLVSRTGYSNYMDVNQAEDFTDNNGDGVCNENEPFVDVNGNGIWDGDRALLATDGARDAVVYEVTAVYDRAFPLTGLLGFEPTTNVTARTILRNQPFNAQGEYKQAGNCA